MQIPFGRHVISTGDERFVAQISYTPGAANAGPTSATNRNRPIIHPIRPRIPILPTPASGSPLKNYEYRRSSRKRPPVRRDDRAYPKVDL